MPENRIIPSGGVRRVVAAVLAWFDTASLVDTPGARERRIDWLRTLPFSAMHLGCAAVLWVRPSAVAVAVAISLYALRMFAITGFYHRYFAHRTFRTNRGIQFLFALLAASAAQRGPLWWAAHHRHHHAHSDEPPDVHSPRRHGFLWSHVGWFLSPANFPTRVKMVPDLMRFPELRWLDRFDVFVPILLGVSLYLAGELLARTVPQWHTDGVQLLVWGFVVSTVALYHATFCINSIAHRFGRRRYETRDDSRNSVVLALITLGEGWHNNHHHFPGSARQGFYWWEIDLTYYLLRLLAFLGLIWDLRALPARVRESMHLAEAQRP